jgi:hypothetical protein
MRISFDFYWRYAPEKFLEITNNIANRLFPFIPNELILDDEYDFNDGIKILNSADIKNDKDLNMIIIGEENGEVARLYLDKFKWGELFLVKMHIDANISNQNAFSFYQRYVAIENLICCFIYNSKDEKWQTENRISEYELAVLTHAHLPRSRDKANRLVIDTSENWGRSVHLMGMKFMAAGKMFFGNIVDRIVPEHILLSCGGRSLTIGRNKLIEVDLFDPFSSDSGAIRNQQRNLYHVLVYLKN